MGLLIETEQIVKVKEEEYAFIGELSLNAKLRACSGVLPMVIAAKESGIKNVIVPLDNVKEASLVQGINIFGFNSLIEVVEYLENRREYETQVVLANDEENDRFSLDFRDVQGQEALIEYIVIAASGGHNLLMIGQLDVEVNDSKTFQQYCKYD